MDEIFYRNPDEEEGSQLAALLPPPPSSDGPMKRGATKKRASTPKSHHPSSNKSVSSSVKRGKVCEKASASEVDLYDGEEMLASIEFKSIPRPYLYYDYHYLANPKYLKMIFDKPVTLSKCQVGNIHWLKNDEVRFALDTSQISDGDRQRIQTIENSMAKKFTFYKTKYSIPSILGVTERETLFFTFFLTKKPFYLQDAKSTVTDRDLIPDKFLANVELSFTGIKVPKIKSKSPFEAKYVYEIGQIMFIEEVNHVDEDDDDNDSNNDYGQSTLACRGGHMTKSMPACIFSPVRK